MKNQDDSHLGTVQPEPKRKTRKTKKQTEKELLLDYNYDKLPEDSLLNKYTMMHHLSNREKKIFEDKFTKPKNGMQRDYSNLLNDRSIYIYI